MVTEIEGSTVKMRICASIVHTYVLGVQLMESGGMPRVSSYKKTVACIINEQIRITQEHKCNVHNMHKYCTYVLALVFGGSLGVGGMPQVSLYKKTYTLMWNVIHTQEYVRTYVQTHLNLHKSNIFLQ